MMQCLVAAEDCQCMEVYSPWSLVANGESAKHKDMGRVLGFVSLLVVLAAGMYIYKQQIVGTSAPGGATANPRATIDVTGVRNDLVAMANAERRRFASDGKYVDISDLISNGDISMQKPNRGPFSYSSSISDTGFRITASYSGDDPNVARSISIDETMQIRTE